MGSGTVKVGLYRPLKRSAMLRVSSRCCFWSAPTGTQIRLVQQDVRRHQAGVGEQAGIDVVGVLGGFVLKLGHAGELAELGVAVEHPGQLGVRLAHGFG